MCICVHVLIYNCNFRIIISSGKFMYRALASSGLNGGTPCLHNPHIGIAVDNLGPDKGVGLSILHAPPDPKPNQKAELIRTTKPQKGAGAQNRRQIYTNSSPQVWRAHTLMSLGSYENSCYTTW